MIHHPDKPSADQNLLSDILNESGKPKVKLTPEIEKEIREHLAEAQARAERGEPMTREMAEFMENVRLWVGMPKNARKIFSSVESLLEESVEAEKRHISLNQWLDLLKMADECGKKSLDKWIDLTFKFPGDGKIKKNGALFLNGQMELTALPEGLEVSKKLNLAWCPALRILKGGLKVGGSLELGWCTALTSLPDGLEVGVILDLHNCKGLVSLPKGLKVEDHMRLDGCTGLTGLPDDLEVGSGITLSHDLHEEVKWDVERLKRKGNIKGEINTI